MRVYTGQTRSKRVIAVCERLGLGECVNRGELPPRRTAHGWFYGKSPVMRSCVARTIGGWGARTQHIWVPVAPDTGRSQRRSPALLLSERPLAIPSIDTAQLDDVNGGCAACGMANCTMPNSATVPAFFQPTFRR